MMPPTLVLARSVMRFQGYVNVRTSAEPEQVSSARTFREWLDLALFVDWAESEGLQVGGLVADHAPDAGKRWPTAVAAVAAQGVGVKGEEGSSLLRCVPRGRLLVHPPLIGRPPRPPASMAGLQGAP